MKRNSSIPVASKKLVLDYPIKKVSQIVPPLHGISLANSIQIEDDNAKNSQLSQHPQQTSNMRVRKLFSQHSNPKNNLNPRTNKKFISKYYPQKENEEQLRNNLVDLLQIPNQQNNTRKTIKQHLLHVLLENCNLISSIFIDILREKPLGLIQSVGRRRRDGLKINHSLNIRVFPRKQYDQKHSECSEKQQKITAMECKITELNKIIDQKKEDLKVIQAQTYIQKNSKQKTCKIQQGFTSDQSEYVSLLVTSLNVAKSNLLKYSNPTKLTPVYSQIHQLKGLNKQLRSYQELIKHVSTQSNASLIAQMHQIQNFIFYFVNRDQALVNALIHANQQKELHIRSMEHQLQQYFRLKEEEGKKIASIRDRCAYEQERIKQLIHLSDEKVVKKKQDKRIKKNLLQCSIEIYEESWNEKQTQTDENKKNKNQDCVKQRLEMQQLSDHFKKIGSFYKLMAVFY